MEQHYSNLVQKYLANSLTASEQEQLAAMSRLPENRAVWEEMMNAVPSGQPGDRALEAEEDALRKEQADQENDLACESQMEDKETPVPERQLQHEGPPAFKWQIEVQIDPALKRIMEREEAALFGGKTGPEDDPASEKQLRQEGAPVLKWQIEQPALKRLIEAEEDLLIERQSEHEADLAPERQTAQDGTPGLNGQKTDEGSPVHKDTETPNGHPTHEASPSLNGHNDTAAPNGHPTHEAPPSLNGHNDTAARNGHPAHEASPSRNGHNDAACNGYPAHEASPSLNEHPPLKKIITQTPPKRQRLDLERRIAAWKEKAVRQPPKRQRLDLESRIATWEEKTTPRPPFNKQKLKLSIAATIIAIAVLSVIGYYMLLRHKAQRQRMEVQNRQLITPGSDRATLILSDGTAMALDNTKDGILTVQNGVEVTKSYNELAYKAPVSGSKAVSNTIATPRGGEYQLILPDGSHVTLNAASSLTFPTIFNGVVREVTLSGEAFFEVAEDSARPFRVKAGETVVEVIGTSFNLMSYPNEPVQSTTMVSGSVKLNALRLAYILRPGEQAILNYRSSRVQIKGADVEETVAWRNGKFQFVKQDIHTIMRQVERWYNVDVEMKGDFSDVVLSAAMTRKETVSQLLETLEATGDVRFETEGKRITVFSEK